VSQPATALRKSSNGVQSSRLASARISSTPTGLLDPRTSVRSVVSIEVH
jgi:hypothetical protein